MRNADSFLSRDERQPTRRPCSPGPANTQWIHTSFMTRKVPIAPRLHYRNVIVRHCRHRPNLSRFPDMRANAIPRKAFE